MVSSKTSKSRKGNRSDRGSTDNAAETLLEGMDIARAVYHNDPVSLAPLIEKALPGDGVAVEDVAISRSVGESFTGGRSTPVYRVTCRVVRQNKKRIGRSFVAKLVLMPDNNDDDAAVAMKRESYAVERRFYDCAAPRLRGAGLAIPRLLASDRDGSRPWPAVLFFMNDVRYANSGSSGNNNFVDHPGFLSPTEAKRALRWIATLHALFWNEPDGNKISPSWRRDLWDRGGFWTTDKRQRNKGDNNDSSSNNSSRISSRWAQTIRWVESKHPHFLDNCDTKQIGRFLQASAKPISGFLNRHSKGPKGTLIHGDYKAANMFLQRRSAADEEENNNDGGSADDSPSGVAVVDFQFAGGGLGPEDAAYLLFPDARGHYFDDETELLETYHEEFVSQLLARCKGGPSSMSLREVRGYYELSRIQFLSHLLEQKGWVGSTIGDLKLVSAVGSAITRMLSQGRGKLPDDDNEWDVLLSDFVRG